MNLKEKTLKYKWYVFPAAIILGLMTVYAVNHLSTTGSNEVATSKAPEPSYRSFTLPAGTVIQASLLENLTTKDTVAGREFALQVTSPVVVDGVTVIPSGSKVTGTVAESRRSGRVKGRAYMALTFDSLHVPFGDYKISAHNVAREAHGTKKRDAAIIGGGAGIGAAIGAIAGGGKGAAIGAAVGGGTGTGVVLATRGKETGFARGEIINTKLTEPLVLRQRLQ